MNSIDFEVNITYAINDQNAQDFMKRTPLMLSIIMHRYDIVRCLIENGASNDLHDRSGRTALSTALLENDETIMKIMAQYSFGGYKEQTCTMQ